MTELKDDSVVLDVLENDHTWIYKLDKSLEDRQAWVARLKKRLVMGDTISYIGEVAIAPKDNKCNIWERSIYRTPTCIREVDPVAYEPRVLSLGPYHHGKPQFRAMDELKWGYFQRFLNRNQEKDLDDYLAVVEELESQARGAYSELESPVDSKDFIQMMLLDCCFVLEFLLINDVNDEEEEEEKEEEEEEEEDAEEKEEEEEEDAEEKEEEEEDAEDKEEEEEEPENKEEQDEEEKKEEDEEEEEDEEDSNDPIGNTAWAMPFVMRDMLLLENQLPFFLLERLLKLNSPHQTPSLTQLIRRMFWDLMPGKIRKTPTNIRFQHILHLLYSCTIPTLVEEDNKKSPSPASLPCLFKMFPRGARKLRRHVQKCIPCSNPVAPVDPDEPTLDWIPCAKKLREAGVVFKRKDKYVSFLDVTFKRGIMEIPPLQIFGYIDCVFRNLIAFEQCDTSNIMPFYISAYAYLMNFVIDTPTDVQLLKQEGIIVSTLGSDEDVAFLFNELRKNTALPNTSYLTSVFKGIKNHCHKRRNRWKATLNHNYFSNPWAIISVAAAFFLFALTIMQTVLAFFSYLRPP